MKIVAGVLVVVAAAVGWAGPAPAAHTESDLVAVAAGAATTVNLRPTHGCGASPTVRVQIRADVAGATAGAVPGWTATATPDGAARTVLEWSGGSLPADEAGAFPVEFTAPSRPGELLVFPAVQTCADGQELAWIDGDPAGEYPAPRLLILPAGSAPATTIDEVPADAPGREQLVAILDVDNPSVTTTAPTSTAPPASTTSSAPPPPAPGPSPSPTAGGDGDGDDGGSSGVLVVGGAAVLAAATAGAVALSRARRRDQGAGARGGDTL